MRISKVYYFTCFEMATSKERPPGTELILELRDLSYECDFTMLETIRLR